MNNSKIEAIDILDRIIVGRVEPHIYAFTTNTVPNYLKVGDTYRPVSKRLNEWREFFPELEKQYENKAIINEETYFRDYSIHQYLENDLNKKRLKPDDLEEGLYYSREFFKETEILDIDNAIEDIKENYQANSSKYEYYSSENRLPQTYHYQRGENWDLRPNQEAAVNSFIQAVKNGRRNLLMYAVMRFGKSFTSLCCALEMKAQTVLVVSAKADVKDEWKKTVESAGNFPEYVFIESSDLLINEKAISEKHSKGKKVVIFLTLQDLQGDTIKDRHKEIFGKQIDLLIVDETHFGARAESFGKILKDAGYDKSDEKNIGKLEDETVDVSEADIEIKKINAKIRLHLSGTPYRILMGSEFEKEDIISFVQFSDIVKEQEEWDKKYLNNDDINEWDNPYYGFPQMVRFAFNPNKSSRAKMEALRKSGVSFAFSKLFEPLSIKKDTKNLGHKKFINESEILDLLKVIDGSKEDEELLGFLDYDKIKEGKMCRHMVMVLPYCASCDAMAELISTNKSTFKNLGEYEVINISGVDARRKYSKPDDIKRKIKECEENNQKTLTLTVNRMLTGSTVEQWDTMLYFKDTASPQEYDQSIFRLQNQYIRMLSSKKGIIKENLKPQTLLVDFDPNRLFRMQEQKSLIYNVNTEENGNSKLKERIIDELRISPIIVMNHNKIKQVDATNILEAVTEYNNQRSVSDEVVDIPVDLSLLNDEDIRSVIESQAEFNSKHGLKIEPNQGEGDELTIDDITYQTQKTENDKEKYTQKEYIETKTDNEIKKLESQIKTYYQRLLFYSFLTKDKVSSLDDILNTFKKDENQRIANNLHIDKNVLQKISDMMDPFKRSSLDYKIQNISMLASDESVAPLDRAMIAIRKFNRMSASEVITPSKVCDEMVELLPEDELRKIVAHHDKFLDIASKSGEYAVALYKKLTKELGFEHKEVENLIYSIPTSPMGYEFTRRFYEILGLNTENIASKFNSYDLIEIKNEISEINYEKISSLLKQNKIFSEITLKEHIKDGDEKMKFSVVIGNPPYQKTIRASTQGNNANTVDIYEKFKDLSLCISDISVLLYPAKKIQRGKQDLTNKHLVYLRVFNGSNKESEKNIPGEPSIFGDSVRRIPGDVGMFFWNKNNKNDKIIYQNLEIDRTNKILPVRKELIPFALKLSKYANTFKIGTIKKSCESNFVENNPTFVKGEVLDRDKIVPDGYTKVLTNNIGGSGGKAKWYYIQTDKLDFKQPNVYKVIIASAYPNESLRNTNNMEILDRNEMFGRSRMSIYVSENKKDTINFIKFLRTKFAKVIILMTPLKILYYLPNFDDIKNDIDWTRSIDDIDEQLFKKYGFSEDEKEYIRNSIKEIQ